MTRSRAQASLLFQLCLQQALATLRAASQSKIRAATDGFAVRVVLQARGLGIKWGWKRNLCPAPWAYVCPQGLSFF